MKIVYIPVEQSLNSPFTGRYRTYGIAAVDCSVNPHDVLDFIPDVSIDREFVSALADHCTRGELEPIHLMQIIEDSI